MNKEELKEELADKEAEIYKSMKEFFLPSEEPEKNTLCDESEPEEPAEKPLTRGERLIYRAMLIVSVLALIGVLWAVHFEGEQDKERFENNWTVVSDSVRECTVTASQLAQDARGRYETYAPVITVQTADGDAAIFCGVEGRKPVAGLSVGDSCTVCIKEYHSHDKHAVNQYQCLDLKDGDTAWFINDTIVFRLTKEESENLFMKSFE